MKRGHGKDTTAQAKFEYFLKAGKLDLAREEAFKALIEEPDSTVPELLLCEISSREGNWSAVRHHLNNANEKDVSATYALQIGIAFQKLGCIREAETAFLAAIGKGNIPAYEKYFFNRKATDRDRCFVNEMRRLASQPGLDYRSRAALAFGMAKFYNDTEDYENAMKYFHIANWSLADTKGASTSGRGGTSFVDQIMRLRLEVGKGASLPMVSSQSPIPIFVTGMIRSGTTLVEQILSCHPQVIGGGELGFLPQDFKLLNSGDSMNCEQLRGVTHFYLERLRRIGGKAKFVTDKMPGNSQILGLLHAFIPQGKLIYIRRQPVDTCLSVYMTPNAGAPPFAHRPDELVETYKQHIRLMDYWRSTLPKNCIYEVEYESLVFQPEETTRNLLGFCGLEWDERCLHPELRAGFVSTPSAWQVRQPINSHSVGRWLRYRPYLGSFERLLPLSDSAPLFREKKHL